MSTTIAFMSRKGGVGKTTSTHAIATALHETGKTVLIIDFDPQGSITAATRTPTDNGTIAHVLDKQKTLAEVSTEIKPGLYVCPADDSLASVEMGLVSATGREYFLTDVLEEVSTDYVLIDCAPGLGLLSVNGLVASQYAVVPTLPQFLDLRGLKSVIDNIQGLNDNKRIQANIKPLGVVLTQFDGRLNLHKEAVQLLEREGISLLGTISKSVRVAESAGLGQSIVEYRPTHPISDEYRRIANVIIEQ